MKHEVFKNELMTIQNEDVRNFAIYLLDNAPDYFYTVPASSTGKYHPQYALGEGGLVRHTKALIGIMNSLLELEQYQVLFSELKRDLLRVAGLIHDCLKQGDGKTQYTVFEHPLLASEWLKEMWIAYNNKGNINISASAMTFIQECIVAHMGEWNTNKRSEVILPKPATEAQKFVHMCDYLASRKNLEYVFDDKIFTPTTEFMTTLETYRIPFGKYRHMLLTDLIKLDRGYLEWLNGRENLDTTLRGYLEELLNKKDL